MDLFSSARKKQAAQPAKSKGTPWMVGDPNGDVVAKRIDELVRLNAELKAIEAKMDVAKGVVKKHAMTNLCNDVAQRGVLPETPMYVQNGDGQKVTFVLQDRSSQYKVKEEQQEALSAMIGPDAAADLLYTEVTYSFNREVLAVPGVQEAIGKAVSAAVSKLLDKGVLTEEQAGSVFAADEKTAFKPGTLDRVAMIVGRDSTRIKQFLEIMGSSATNYVRV